MNRYDTLKLAQFTPRSLEELAVVPAAFRQKHDKLEMAQEAMRSQANAAVDPLAQHSDLARQVQDKINGALDKQSDSLNEHGFNQMAQSNMIKLNRDYQNAMGANGIIGKINAAKKTYAEQYKQFREEGIKAGHSAEDVDANWASQASNYTGFDKDGNVSVIQAKGAPLRYDVMDWAKDVKPLLGKYQRRLDAAGGGSIELQGDGSVVVRSKTGSVQHVTNDPAINAITQSFKANFLSPGGKGYQSTVFRNLNPLNTYIEANGLLNAMRIDEINDTVNYGATLHGYQNPKTQTSKGSRSVDGFEGGISDPLTPGQILNSKNQLGYTSGNALFNRYYKLQKNTKRTPAEENEFRKLNVFMDQNSILTKDKNYLALGQQVAKSKASFKGGFDPTAVVSKTSSARGASATEYTLNGEKLSEKQTHDYLVWTRGHKKTVDKFKEAQNKIYNQAILPTQEYTFAKTGVAATDKYIDAQKSNIISDLTNGATNFKISQLEINDGDGKKFKPDANHVKTLTSSLKGTSSSDMEVVSTFANQDGSTSYRVRVKPNDKRFKTNFSSGTFSNYGNTRQGYEMIVTTGKQADSQGIETSHGRLSSNVKTLGPNSNAWGNTTQFQNLKYNYEKTVGKPLTIKDASETIHGGNAAYLRSVFNGVNSGLYENFVSELNNQIDANVARSMSASQAASLQAGTMSKHTYDNLRYEYIRNNENTEL